MVSVQIEVRAVETETTVAVRPNIESGTPAPGFALEAIGVDPAYVTIVGLPEVLAEITSVTTEPISIDGLSADETFEVELQLPDDVTPRRWRAVVGHRDRDDRSVGLQPHVRRRRRLHRRGRQRLSAAARPDLDHR